MRQLHRIVFLLIFFLAGGRAQAGEDPPLIDVHTLAPGVVLDLRYASPNNFTGRTLYPAAQCLLCEPAAHRLAAVQAKLERQGLGLKVWDCYRPLSIQRVLWSLVPDDRYVADPKTGSRHNRGASVDLTLVDSKGRELPMPTGFDDFTPKAHREFRDLPAEAIKNRELLRSTMESEGFLPLATEWWHFDAPEWSRYALRDEPLGSPSLKADQPAGSDLSPLERSRQLIVVTAKDWTSQTGRLQRYTRNKATWKKEGKAWPVALGIKGMSWGSGRQLFNAAGPNKTEGDLTAPAGVFGIGTAFGYERAAPPGVGWPYQHLSERWLCVDDPASRFYNQIINSEGLAKDWLSAETMRRTDVLYKWGLNIEQNFPDVRAGCGSCIFFHIWRSPGSPTEGCTAMAESDLLTLLRWLNPVDHPVVVQLPDAIFAEWGRRWKLP